MRCPHQVFADAKEDCARIEVEIHASVAGVLLAKCDCGQLQRKLPTNLPSQHDLCIYPPNTTDRK
jgi:hypothetical protein